MNKNITYKLQLVEQLAEIENARIPKRRANLFYNWYGQEKGWFLSVCNHKNLLIVQ